MLALLALIAFVISVVVYGSVHGWVFWFLLGAIFIAADRLLAGAGYGERTYFGRSRG